MSQYFGHVFLKCVLYCIVLYCTIILYYHHGQSTRGVAITVQSLSRVQTKTCRARNTDIQIQSISCVARYGQKGGKFFKCHPVQETILAYYPVAGPGGPHWGCDPSKALRVSLDPQTDNFIGLTIPVSTSPPVQHFYYLNV